MVEYALWAEMLLVTLPYAADNLAGRTAQAGAAARAWEQAAQGLTGAAHPTLTGLLLALPEGRWAEARQLAEAGRGSPHGHLFQGASVALARLARHQGEPAAAWARVAELHPAGSDTAPGDCHFPHGIALQAVAAELALDAGDPALARAWIAVHGRWLEWSGAVLWRADHQLLRARHARAYGDLVTARQHAESALALANEPRQPLALLAAHRLLGELATDAGRHAEATMHLDAALALADACAAPYERALALLALAELRFATGDHDGARAALGTARALLEPLEARPALARADALAARLAAPAPIAATVALPFGLSAREAEVLRLVAEGLSDAQVADRLFLSPYTVKAHLRSIYNKLGAENRTAASRLAIERGLT
jgi:ATP/maltotriose-dependent transcriptional regulator MalT